MIALGAVSLGVADAEAKRVGGGGAIGLQSQNVSRQAPPAAAPAHGKVSWAAHCSAWAWAWARYSPAWAWVAQWPAC